MRRLHVAALTAASLVATTAVTACSGDSQPVAGPSAPAASSPPATSGLPSVAVSAAPNGAAAPSAAVAFVADTVAKSAPSSGGAVTLRAVRVAPHDGYDRVVFELDGDATGVPGYDVAYTRDPRQPGSGARVPVRGARALRVVLHGIGYPFDTGVQEPSSSRLPAGLVAVTDVVLGATYEGDYQAVVGTSGMLPFRVIRLTKPARVVIDVRRS